MDHKNLKTGQSMESLRSFKTGEIIEVDGCLAQFRTYRVDRQAPVYHVTVGISPRQPAVEWDDILGQVPWSPPGTNSWSGEVRIWRTGGRMYFNAEDLEVSVLALPVRKPRASKRYSWEWAGDGLDHHGNGGIDGPWLRILKSYVKAH